MAGWITMPLGMEVGLGPGDFLLVGDPGPHFQKGSEPPHFAHVYCGESAGYIKMPLGMEVGLSPGDFGLDGDPALPGSPSQKGGGGRGQTTIHFASSTTHAKCN